MGIRQALGFGAVDTLTVVKGMVDRAIAIVDPLAVEVPGFNPRDNYEDYETLYYTDPDVNTAINVISTLATGGGITWEAKSENTVKSKEKWARMAGFKTKLANNITTHLIFGDSYTLPVKDKKVKTALQVLHPAHTKVVPDETGLLKEYIHDPDKSFNKGGKGVNVYDPEDVLHFRHNQIVNNLHGISLIHPGHDILALLRKIEITAATLAHRDAHRLLHARVTPRNNIELSTNPATQKTYLEEKIRAVNKLLSDRVQERTGRISTVDPGRDTTAGQETYSGKAYKISNTITTDDMVELKDLTASHNWVGLVQIIKHFQEKSYRSLRVPPVFMGQAEGSNRATSHNQLRTFKLYIQGIQEHFVEVIEANLLPMLPGDADLVLNPPFRDDDSAWAEVAALLYEKGVMLLDESRSYVGLPPLEEDEPAGEEVED